MPNLDYIKNKKIVSTLADLRTISGGLYVNTPVEVAGYYAPYDGGGGTFIWDSQCTLPDDGGGIIKLTAISRGRFIRMIENGVVNLKGWGIKPHLGYTTYTSEYDTIPRFHAAMAFMSRFNHEGEIYVPATNAGIDGTYYCSTTLILDRPIAIRGDGRMDMPTTRFVFPPRVKCIYVPDIHSNLSLTNLHLRQDWDFHNYGDRQGHGIHSRAIVNFKNVHVSGVAGVAYLLEGCMIPSSPIYGSTDFSRLDNCYARECDFGLVQVGCDANKIVTYQFNAAAIRRWGIDDNGMLGNMHFCPHLAFCGSDTSHEVVVIYDNKYYCSITDNNIGNQPDISPLHWEIVDPMSAQEWTATKAYQTGGPIRVQDANAWSMVIDPYYEGWQPPTRLNSRSMAFNGTPGVATVGGSNTRVLFGTGYKSASMVVPSMLLGKNLGPYEWANDTPLHCVYDSTKSQANAAIFESLTPAMWMIFKNSQTEMKMSYIYEVLNMYCERVGVKSLEIRASDPNTITPAEGTLYYFKEGTPIPALGWAGIKGWYGWNGSKYERLNELS